MLDSPLYIPLVFLLALASTITLFLRATKLNGRGIVILIAWIALQGGLALSGFYEVTEGFPPRPVFAVLPPNLLIVWLLVSKQGRDMIDRWNPKWLTLIHVVRIPIELVLYWLFLYKGIPEIMTFEGQNFDILAGLTAPVVVWLGYYKQKMSRTLLLVWNLLCLGLLLNIVGTAILAIPGPLQRIAFDQPNVAITQFPYVWLASIIVPIVFVAHLVTIRGLLYAK